jgi:hypothetical protein
MFKSGVILVLVVLAVNVGADFVLKNTVTGAGLVVDLARAIVLATGIVLIDGYVRRRNAVREWGAIRMPVLPILDVRHGGVRTCRCGTDLRRAKLNMDPAKISS